MRVLIQADMEGVSQLTDFRELIPLWPHYWQTGRGRLTDDVAAAAAGLLEGGATEVFVDDQHLGLGTTIDPARLPQGATLARPDWVYPRLRERAFDAVFQVGRHARWGSNHAFVAHTQMPGMAIAVDGRPITECHIAAWRAGAPVLGITGDGRLGPQVDGDLAGTPFLAVKHSRGLTGTRPALSDAARGQARIRAFAAACARDWRARPRPSVPAAFTFAAGLEPEVADGVEGRCGLVRTGRGVLTKECTDWWRDAEPALQAVTGAVARPLMAALAGFDISSEATALAADPAELARVRELFGAWLQRPEVSWLK